MPKFAHPGEVLRRQYVEPAGIKSADLARATGLSTGRISEILHGKRDITPEIAYRLHLATGTSPQLWLNMQNGYDLHMIAKKKARSIKKQTRLLVLPDLATA